MTIYAEIDQSDRRILQTFGRLSDSPEPPPTGPYLYQELSEPISFAEPYVGAVLKWLDGADEPEWVDTRTIEDAIADGVAKVDQHADTARASVVGDPVRVKEYEYAQQQAEQFRDSGFSGAAPSCVACWATAKEWTAQQAAEDILAASDRWIGALVYIRALRLQAKEDIRRATANAEADAILATFTATLTTAMQGVQ